MSCKKECMPNACRECARACPQEPSSCQQLTSCQQLRLLQQQQQQQQQQMQLCEEITPALEILEKLNHVFERRLSEINEQANGDATLKEITYKEWIDLLNQTNRTLIRNIQELDCETTSRLDLMQRKSGSVCADPPRELSKCQEDIQKLLDLIRRARQTGDWNTDGYNFETLTEGDIFGELSGYGTGGKSGSQSMYGQQKQGSFNIKGESEESGYAAGARADERARSQSLYEPKTKESFSFKRDTDPLYSEDRVQNDEVSGYAAGAGTGEKTGSQSMANEQRKDFVNQKIESEESGYTAGAERGGKSGSQSMYGQQKTDAFNQKKESEEPGYAADAGRDGKSGSQLMYGPQKKESANLKPESEESGYAADAGRDGKSGSQSMYGPQRKESANLKPESEESGYAADAGRDGKSGSQSMYGPQRKESANLKPESEESGYAADAGRDGKSGSQSMYGPQRKESANLKPESEESGYAADAGRDGKSGSQSIAGEQGKKSVNQKRESEESVKSGSMYDQQKKESYGLKSGSVSSTQNSKKESGSFSKGLAGSSSRSTKRESGIFRRDSSASSSSKNIRKEFENNKKEVGRNSKPESEMIKKEFVLPAVTRSKTIKPEKPESYSKLTQDIYSEKKTVQMLCRRKQNARPSCENNLTGSPFEMTCRRNIGGGPDEFICILNTGEEMICQRVYTTADGVCYPENYEPECGGIGSEEDNQCQCACSCCFDENNDQVHFCGRQNKKDPEEICNSANIKEEEINSGIDIKPEPDNENQSSNVNSKNAQKSKLLIHLKALAVEIAERHDEMRDLKRQIISLEEDILYAQKKLQLKDDFIKGLRNDLKALPKSQCAASSVARRVSDQSPPPIEFCPKMMSETNFSESTEIDFDATPRLACHKNRDSTSSLNVPELNFNIYQEDEEEDNLVKNLKDELAQFFEIQDSYDQSFGNQKRELQDLQPRISRMVDELVKTNINLQNKLKYYRRELLNLEVSQSNRTITDEDSGISSDVDPDNQIVHGVRSRMICFVNEIHNLQREGNRLRIENEDFISQAKAKSELLDKTSRALREIADAISIALNKPIHYEQIFDENSTCQRNPIVDALDELLNTLAERERIIQDLREKLASTAKTNIELQATSESLQQQMNELKNSMGMNNGQYENGQVEHNTRCKLLQNEKFSRMLYEKAEQFCGDSSEDTRRENHSEYLRIIDDLSTDLNTLSCQVNMVQSEFLNDELSHRFENSLKDLETQNDLLQAAVDKVTEEKVTIERRLQSENEELKNMVHELRQTVCYQQNKIDELMRKPCERCQNMAQLEAKRQLEQKPSCQRTISDEKLDELESELKWKGQLVEKLKLENECLRRDLDTQANRVKCKNLQSKGSIPDRCQSNLKEILSKLNATQEKNLEQCKALHKASKQISCLQNEIEALRANEECYKKERHLLHSELIALKENEATQLGVTKSLKEQLQRTTNELMYTKEKLCECTEQNQRLESTFKEQRKRFQEMHTELIKKHNNLVEDYNDKAEEYQKLVQINEEKDKLLCSIEAWKNEQIQKDCEMQEKTQLFEQNMSALLDENHKLLRRLNETESQILELQQCLENSRLSLSGHQSGGSVSLKGGYKGCYANSVTMDPVCQVIDDVRHTARKISYRRAFLEDETRTCAK